MVGVLVWGVPAEQKDEITMAILVKEVRQVLEGSVQDEPFQVYVAWYDGDDRIFFTMGDAVKSAFRYAHLREPMDEEFLGACTLITDKGSCSFDGEERGSDDQLYTLRSACVHKREVS